jgi:dUTP pyrophosphatase
MVLLANLGAEAYVVHPGDRVAQLVIAPVVIAELEEAESLEESKRGDGGFGHTGR